MMMRCSALNALSGAALLVLCTLGLAGCAGGNSYSSSNPTSPTTPEYLYSENDGDVTAYSINASTGALTMLQTISPPSTGYTGGAGIVATSNGNYIYSEDALTTGINAYSVGAGGTLTLLSGSPFAMPASFSTWPYISSIAINPPGTALYAVDAGDSSVAEFQINASTGALTAVSTGFSPDPGAASISPERAAMDPSGTFLYVTDSYLLGTTGLPAGISSMTIDPTSGNLGQATGSPIDLPSNSQPGDIVTAQSGNFVYAALNNSMAAGGSIAAYTRNATTGALTQIAGSPFTTTTGNPQTTSLAVHPSGKFLYAYNLDGGTISAFSIDSTTGVLTPVAGSPFAPQTIQTNLGTLVISEGPIAIDPSGSFLYEGTGYFYVSIYDINQSTGALTMASGSPEATSQEIEAFTFIEP